MNVTLPPRETPIEVGAEAPDFTLKTQTKDDWTLSAELEKGDVVLCFYPMDFSSVCSTEMKCVTDDFAKWEAKGAQVVGVSCDSFFVHEAWAKELGLKQTLLADMHREVCKAYGFYWPDLNVSSRGTVVVSKGDGGPVVKWVQSRDIPNAMNFDEVLAAIS
ncbi:MAG: redoxin domain-containing protein [Planctomycetota bacterium]